MFWPAFMIVSRWKIDWNQPDIISRESNRKDLNSHTEMKISIGIKTDLNADKERSLLVCRCVVTHSFTWRQCLQCCSAAVWSHVSEVAALNGPHVSPVQWPPPQKTHWQLNPCNFHVDNLARHWQIITTTQMIMSTGLFVSFVHSSSGSCLGTLVNVNTWHSRITSHGLSSATNTLTIPEVYPDTRECRRMNPGSMCSL